MCSVACSSPDKEEKPDNIKYYDIKDTVITSIDSFKISDNLEYCQINYPPDSTSEYKVDIDSDDVFDFKITHSHKYGCNSNCGSPHVCYYENYSTHIYALENNMVLH